jgi:hypothetical protein
MGEWGTWGETPENCDCCGRDAEDCGMDDQGWLRRDATSGFPGVYCVGCASLLRLVLWSEECAQCAVRTDSESAAERDGWRYFADELGRLVPFCPVCTAMLFGIAPPQTAAGNAEVPGPLGDDNL